MSLIRVDTVKNGDHLENFNIYKCDISGVDNFLIKCIVEVMESYHDNQTTIK